jgi:hypothetical protein
MPTIKSKDVRCHTAPKLRFFEPMYVAVGKKVAGRRRLAHRGKLDGYRALAGRDSSGVSGSRREKVFTDQFAASARGCESLEPGTLLYGGIGDGAADLEHAGRALSPSLLMAVFNSLLSSRVRSCSIIAMRLVSASRPASLPPRRSCLPDRRRLCACPVRPRCRGRRRRIALPLCRRGAESSNRLRRNPW